MIMNYVYTSPLTFQSPFSTPGIFLTPACAASGAGSTLCPARGGPTRTVSSAEKHGGLGPRAREAEVWPGRTYNLRLQDTFHTRRALGWGAHTTEKPAPRGLQARWIRDS